jgi:hypothetical protein
MLSTSHREQFRLPPQTLTHFRPRCSEDLCSHHAHQCHDLVKRCIGMDRTDDPSGLPAPEKQMGFKYVRQQQSDHVLRADQEVSQEIGGLVQLAQQDTVGE